MLHNWTIGASGSGKTALNKVLCDGLRRKGITTAVLDPLRDGGWNADICTHDVEKFWAWLLSRREERVAVFWEEASISVDRQDKRFNLAAVCGRHAGWRIYLISQNYTMPHPQVREMCKERWIFNCDADSAHALHRTYRHDVFRELPNLPPLHFYRARPFKPLQKGNLVFSGRRTKINLTDI